MDFSFYDANRIPIFLDNMILNCLKFSLLYRNRTFGSRNGGRSQEIGSAPSEISEYIMCCRNDINLVFKFKISIDVWQIPVIFVEISEIFETRIRPKKYEFTNRQLIEYITIFRTPATQSLCDDSRMKQTKLVQTLKTELHLFFVQA